MRKSDGSREEEKRRVSAVMKVAQSREERCDEIRLKRHLLSSICIS